MAKRVPTRPNPRSQKVAGQQPPGFFGRRSTRWLGAALALFLVVGIAGVFYLARGANEVSVDDAVSDFRSESDAVAPTETSKPAEAQKDAPVSGSTSTQPGVSKTTQPASPAQTALAPPTDGVYVYATEGYEETDALAGQRHDYPKETTITNRKGGCTWTSRWQPLEERWEQNDFCEKPEGTFMQHYTMYHEFFQRGVREDFTCDGYVYKRSAKPGDTWTFTCKSDQSTAKSDTKVMGFEQVNVGGTTVQALHIRYDITVSGANRGKMTQDRWFSDEPRAMIRVTQNADLEVASPFGAVGYKESFRLDLKSLAPRT